MNPALCEIHGLRKVQEKGESLLILMGLVAFCAISMISSAVEEEDIVSIVIMSTLSALGFGLNLIWFFKTQGLLERLRGQLAKKSARESEDVKA